MLEIGSVRKELFSAMDGLSRSPPAHLTGTPAVAYAGSATAVRIIWRDMAITEFRTPALGYWALLRCFAG